MVSKAALNPFILSIICFNPFGWLIKGGIKGGAKGAGKAAGKAAFGSAAKVGSRIGFSTITKWGLGTLFVGGAAGIYNWLSGKGGDGGLPRLIAENIYLIVIAVCIVVIIAVLLILSKGGQR